MPGKLFGSPKTTQTEQSEVSVILPEETHTVMQWRQDDLPCIGVLNAALKDFPHKEIFDWHLSLVLDFEELIDNGMPSEEEREVVDPFCDRLDAEIKAGGNALFLIRETWNGTRRLVWRVHDPQIAHRHLQHVIEQRRNTRPFNYHIKRDLEWKEAAWFFDQI